MARRVFGAAAIVSCVLFLTCAIGVVRSLNFVSDSASYNGARIAGRAEFSSGKLFLLLSVADEPGRRYGWRVRTEQASNYQPSQEMMPRRFAIAGLALFAGHAARSPAMCCLSLPPWITLPVTAALPLWWSVRRLGARRRAMRLAAGCCPDCGYDMRATPGRCPECGAAAPSTAAPT